MRQALATEFNLANIYLNSATYGLACDKTIQVMQEDLHKWRLGTLKPHEYDETINRCRSLFARIVDTEKENIALANQVAPLVGMLAASMPPGTKVLTAKDDFTSLLFPFLAQTKNNIQVIEASLDKLADSIDHSIDWVAVSIVQSKNGMLADLAEIHERAKRVGAKVLLDATQSAGWLKVNPNYWDMLVCGAYKWLLAPRGTAFAAIKPELAAQITPINANWYAGERIWDSIYGAPLRLAHDARRFDISPAWLCWAGTLPALEFIVNVGVDEIHEHNLHLANRFCELMNLAQTESAIVSIKGEGIDNKLKAAKIEAAVRAGAVRLSFHLYNSERDVLAVVKALNKGRPIMPS